jgi:hypothetical protein
MADLTTTDRVKSYLAITTAGQDANIGALITRESALVERWCGRQFSRIVARSKRLNGSGTSRLFLPDTPVVSVSSVSVGNTPLTYAADGLTAGFSFDENCIYLAAGERFPYVPQSVAVAWTAGWQETDEQFIPTGNAPTLTPTNGGFAVSDEGVVSAAGTVFTAVGNTPAAGQYVFADGVYAFNIADIGIAVTMSYAYVPGPIEQAVIELVGLDLKQRDNLGIKSKTLAGENVTYEDRGLPTSITDMLRPYRQMVPA